MSDTLITKFTDDVDVVISQTEPEDDNVYWIYF